MLEDYRQGVYQRVMIVHLKSTNSRTMQALPDLGLLHLRVRSLASGKEPQVYKSFSVPRKVIMVTMHTWSVQLLVILLKYLLLVQGRRNGGGAEPPHFITCPYYKITAT